MTPPKIKVKTGPEAKIQADICLFLRARGWFVKETHGNMFQKGFPDLYATHVKYRQRWIEIKQPVGYSFTAAQLEDFPLLEANGSPIWIMTAATETEYLKLWKPSNWSFYLMAMNIRGCR